MKQRTGAGAVYDMIAGLFVILTILVLVVVVGLLSKKLQPPAAFRPIVAAIPTVFIPPTETPTNTPTSTIPPTYTLIPAATLTSTPITPTATVTPIPPTATETPLVQPTSALDVTLTQVVVDTQAASDALAAASISSATARAGQVSVTSVGTTAGVVAPVGDFPFAQAADIQYTANVDPNLGCGIEAIAGQVFDTNQQPLTSQIQIFIFNASGSYKVLATPLLTSQPPFGVGFWLQIINKHAGKDQYMVEVIDHKLQKQISTTATIQFTGECTKNVALINFKQIKPFVFP